MHVSSGYLWLVLFSLSPMGNSNIWLSESFWSLHLCSNFMNTAGWAHHFCISPCTYTGVHQNCDCVQPEFVPWQESRQCGWKRGGRAFLFLRGVSFCQLIAFLEPQDKAAPSFILQLMAGCCLSCPLQLLLLMSYLQLCSCRISRFSCLTWQKTSGTKSKKTQPFILFFYFLFLGFSQAVLLTLGSRNHRAQKKGMKKDIWEQGAGRKPVLAAVPHVLALIWDCALHQMSL